MTARFSPARLPGPEPTPTGERNLSAAEGPADPILFALLGLLRLHADAARWAVDVFRSHRIDIDTDHPRDFPPRGFRFRTHP
ncbi:hypothetical protein MCA1386 [Methylococcus capsulatus str. Bath]|uniref:Uncharacterized protein n=2 Tax=Methylococcus capsulatus TaxID=414 RepID=Q608V3_METCA|nr:hypothetical protein MCA1386 [Methylococcus capsulatus str. Bath]CAI8889839.1 protein of unknown function [Methylococcus capsulatus]